MTKQLGISVTCKLTKNLDGGFKTIVFTTDAILEEGEDGSAARRALFEELAQDLRACFSPNGKKPGKATKPSKPAKPRKSKEAENPKSESKMCSIHGVAMRRWTNENGGVWYSHRLPDGSWCPGKPRKRSKG